MFHRTKFLVVILALSLGAFATAATAKKEASSIKACVTITESGSYVLTENLTAVGVDCLIVTVDDVTIDLAGFTITGNDTAGTGGVTDDGVVRDNIAVHNGTIRDFERGVDLQFTDGAVVEAIRAVSNTGIGIVVDDDSVVTRSVARDNGGGGVQVDGRGMVTDNLVNNNVGDGIVSIARSFIRGNISNANGGRGFDILCPSFIFDNLAIGNTVENLRAISTTCVLSNNMAP